MNASALHKSIRDAFAAESDDVVSRLRCLEDTVLTALALRAEDEIGDSSHVISSTQSRQVRISTISNGTDDIVQSTERSLWSDNSILEKAISQDRKRPSQRSEDSNGSRMEVENSTKSTKSNASMLKSFTQDLTSSFDEHNRRTFAELTSDRYSPLRQLSTVVKGKIQVPHHCVHTRNCIEKAMAQRYVPNCIAGASQKFIMSHWVSISVTVLIILNAFIMALEADDTMQKSIAGHESARATKSGKFVVEASPKWMLFADLAFAIIFTLELIVRVLVDEVWFWVGKNWVWNGIDSTVVVFAWLEIAVQLSTVSGVHSQKTSGMPPIRLFRLLRVLRSLRVVRAFRFFKELRLVVLSLLHSVKPLLWSILVFGLIMFVFSIFFMQIIAIELELQNPAVNDWDSDNDLLPMFKTTVDAMISLFAYVSGGTSWQPHYVAFVGLNTVAATGFIFYIVIIILGVLNVIAAVFVEVAISKAKGDQQLSLAEEHQTQQEAARELVKIFHLIDHKQTNLISCNDWVEFTVSEAGKDFLTLYDIDVARALSLFMMLDLDDDGEIEIQEFVVGFMRMHGSADKLQQYELETELHTNKMLLRKSLDAIQKLKGTQFQILSNVDRVVLDLQTVMGKLREANRSPPERRVDGRAEMVIM